MSISCGGWGEIGPSAFMIHHGTTAHKMALVEMADKFCSADEVRQQQPGSAFADIPKMEKFHLAATVVSTDDFFHDFRSYGRSLAT